MKFAGRTATAIITFPTDKILLIKRRTVPFRGYWALPGGRVDSGETVEQTIVREVKEETGLDVAIVSKVGDYHEQGVQGGYLTCCSCIIAATFSFRIKVNDINVLR